MTVTGALAGGLWKRNRAQEKDQADDRADGV